MTLSSELPADAIVEQYEVNKLSLNQLSSKFNVSPQTIQRCLIEAGVTLRPKSEAYRLAGLRSKEWHDTIKARDTSSIDTPVLKPSKPKKANHSFPKINHFEIFARDGFRCRYCGRTPQEDGIKLCVEHIVPKSQGGDDCTANLITACYNCNTSKRNKILLGKNKQIPSFIAITTLS